MNFDILKNADCEEQKHIISIIDFFSVIVNQKITILTVISIFLILSIIVALSLPKYFMVDVRLFPAQLKDMEKLNISGLYEANPDHIFLEIIKNLNSYYLRKQFFLKKDIAKQFMHGVGDQEKIEKIFQEDFNSNLSITHSAENKNLNVITVELEGKYPKEIAGWLNGFVSTVEKSTKEEIVEDIEVKIARRMNEINNTIFNLRTNARLKRLDKITILDEAAKIADILGIYDQYDVPNEKFLEKFDLSNNSSEYPLYLRGKKALAAETNILKNRVNDDPFIPELRTLQTELSILKNIRFNTNNFQIIRIDKNAIEPYSPIRPNRILIIGLGVLLGIMSAILIGLAKNLYFNGYQNKSQIMTNR